MNYTKHVKTSCYDSDLYFYSKSIIQELQVGIYAWKNQTSYEALRAAKPYIR